MIKCDLRPIKEYLGVSTGSDRTKFGRYHGSMFWDIPNFASKKWVVAARIDLQEEIPSSFNESELIESCVEYLNTPPPRKKFQRRIRKPKYGRLDLYKAKVIRDDEGMYISALLITDKRSSKHFWGKGIVI